jgi:deoxyribodipyrimidine photo-lyase
MQQSQRVEENHALAFAMETAAYLEKPLVVAFCLFGAYPEARWPHFVFMLEGLRELARRFEALRLPFVLRIGDPLTVLPPLVEKAGALVLDVGYLRHQKEWREHFGQKAGCAVMAVESDVVTPVASALDRRAYGAHVLRRSLGVRWRAFLEEPLLGPIPAFRGLPPGGEDPEEGENLLRRAGVPFSPMPPAWSFRGGEGAAGERLNVFITDKAALYAEARSLPHRQAVSCLSPYLHFGMIAPSLVVRRIEKASLIPSEAKAAFLEQLVVRRELAMNFVYYTKDYDCYGSLPTWALETLDAHRKDARAFVYSLSDLENARTHDPYWNAAMMEARRTGYMHNVMRMYWGKKVLEWSSSPEEAFERLIFLNNRYFLDGRDPCSYAGCGWIFGLHDRPWPSRPVFGSVRFMAASGLERKSRIGEYVSWVDSLV